MTLALSGADAGHLVAAAGLTYALGFERALRGATAGDRVFSLIGIGSGVVGIIALHGAPNALAGAITGVGFIGGGLVFRRAVGRDQVVVGLNTAAAIFAAAAIGAAAGQGRLLVATVATALTLFVLEIRHLKVVHMLDGRRWAGRFSDDESPPGGQGPGVPGVPRPGVPRPGVPGVPGVTGVPGSGGGPNLDS
jgi:putative Mg2+ transporter-C (MgtC) family protein